MIHPLINLTLVFFGRHWFVAIVNAALTAFLGLGLLRWAEKWRVLKLSALDFLRLHRFVLLCAIYKGTLFLLLGVSFHRLRHFPLIFGIQVPDPLDVLLLAPLGPNSIWYPTSASKMVSLLLVGGANFFLVRRGVQILRSRRALHALLHLGGSTEGTNRYLKRAATALGLPDSLRLPAIVLAEVPYPTPMLVGLRRPYILLAPGLLHLLSEPELEMALRHELAHFQRNDHWWRWLFSWLEDVGRLNLLSDRLGVWALDLEEEICDRMAVRTPQDALILASAIRKSVFFYREKLILPGSLSREGSGVPEDETPVPQPSSSGAEMWAVAGVPRPTSSPAKDDIVLPSTVLPALLGRHTRKWS